MTTQKSSSHKNCLYCNTEFQKPYHTSLNNWIHRSKFCSKDCKHNYQKGKPSLSPNTTFSSTNQPKKKVCPAGSKNPNWKGGQVEKVCPVCDNPFKVDPYRKSAKTCSLKCAGVLKRGKRISPSTEFQPTYLIRDVPSLKLRIRNCSKYNDWRRSVYERDGFKCQICDSGGRLNADHYPISFAEHFRRICIDKCPNIVYKKAIEDTLLWDISNGRTLCVKCHRETNNFGGRNLKP